jgi:4-hydroxy-L-threonine phosphate dehydrogenase PdxA
MKNKIIIVSGDPNSINSEIIYKVWKKINDSTKNKIYIIGSFELLKKQFKKLNYKIKIIKVKNIYENIKSNKLKVIDVKLLFSNPFKVNKNSASKYVINSLNLAHIYAMNKDVSGLINCAIDKNLLKKKQTGVTEYLALKCGVKDKSEVMLIRNNKFSVCPLTTHTDIREIPKKIKKTTILKKIAVIDSWFRKIMQKKPSIGILGLNPHNAELRKKSEEKRIIIPAIQKLKKNGFNVKGPLVADTVFIKDFKNYDVIMGMFHDQVLAPFKAMFKFDAINITLGLKYLRVSPDHGTAKDLIKKNKAEIKSLLNCVKFIDNLKK